MAQIIEEDELEYAIDLVEKSLRELSGEGRSIWTQHDIDPVVNNLLELWRCLHLN